MARISKRKKVLVALSGGVDSSVAAALLKDQGYSVEGSYMRCWSEGAYCSTDQDQTDAARVAAVLGISFRVFDFEKEYRKKVLDYFFAEYEAGRTPNPDVVCNKEIKFGLFLEKAKKLGFDYVATGHYARITNGHGFQLHVGVDKNKDQSYFLYTLGQKQLSRSIFPLGNLTKPKVRILAKEFGLPNANKKDSTGICFVGPVNIQEFLSQKIKTNYGNIVNTEGKVIGRHKGLAFYTIGQREGLGVSQSVPHYVAEKDKKTNKLIVVPIGHKALFKDKFLASNIEWTSGIEPNLPLKVQVKLRYRAPNVKATLKKSKRGRLLVHLDKPQRAITPGQSAVFYQESEVLGGSVIQNTID